MINLLTICDYITSDKKENTITLHIDKNYLLPAYDLTIVGFSTEQMIEFYEDQKGLPNGIVESLPADMHYGISEKIAEMINEEISEEFLNQEVSYESFETGIQNILELFLMQVENEGNEIEIFYKPSPYSLVCKENAHMDDNTKVKIELSETEYNQVAPEHIVEYLEGKEND